VKCAEKAQGLSRKRKRAKCNGFQRKASNRPEN
jgi:hypothetical protein